MYKNKVLGAPLLGTVLPLFGRGSQGGLSASLSGNRSLLAPLPDAHCSPFLPSGDITEETVEQITLRLSLCF